jgi:hypothetical protein
MDIRTSTTRTSALHDLALITIIVFRFMDVWGLLCRYSNGHTKQTYRQLKTCRDYF